jgi:gluconokinase
MLLILDLLTVRKFHSKANIAKMHNGEPLTDSDRQGWLDALSEHASAYPQQPGSHHLIISCSALKRHYRDVLRDGCHHAGDLQVHFLFLDAPESVLRERAETRQGHFAKAELVTSQFDILERPLIEEHDTTMISVNRPIEEVQRDALETIEKVTKQST